MSRSSARPMPKTEPLPESQIRRIREDVLAGYRGAEYGSQIALMHMRGELSGPLYRECADYRDGVERWEAVSEARGVKGQSYEGGRGSSYDPDPDSDEGKKLSSREKKARDNYWRSKAILEKFPRETRLQFERVVIGDETPNHEMKIVVLVCATRLRNAREAIHRVRRAGKR